MRKLVKSGFPLIAGLLLVSCAGTPSAVDVRLTPDGHMSVLGAPNKRFEDLTYRRCPRMEPRDCDVAVRVTLNSTLARCVVSRLKDVIVVGYPTQRVLWKLDPASVAAGYRFAGNAIAIDGNKLADPENPSPDPEFEPIVSLDPTMAGHRARNRDANVFSYTVRVLDASGNPCVPYDPLIVNR